MVYRSMVANNVNLNSEAKTCSQFVMRYQFIGNGNMFQVTNNYNNKISMVNIILSTFL